ncbi:hypothetical protein X777_06296 [Ooceraea biroi]|uniref:Uncharacterized protein n=1 Tax=Ooceraea biroi TaxID=2015173 RepID=A0A026WAU2_OOCBI|nr:hypothetical protein X777_06296 [Ooceraea biroi]
MSVKLIFLEEHALGIVSRSTQGHSRQIRDKTAVSTSRSRRQDDRIRRGREW